MSLIPFPLKKQYQSILSAEKGLKQKKKIDSISCVLASPNTYKVGMSNLGIQKVYSLLNQCEYSSCERVFLPDKKDISLFKNKKIPLFSLETQTPIQEFDIIFFSITFELDYINILEILDLAHIPFKSKDRDSAFPLIVAGGICPTINPEPIADFIDIFVIGEGEVILESLIETFKNFKEKKQLFDHLKKKEGIYIPSEYKIEYKENGTIKNFIPLNDNPHPIKKNQIPDLDSSPTRSLIISPHTIFSNTCLIEIERGCPMQCYFCVGGNLYNKRRYYDLETLKIQIDQALLLTKKIGLVGMAIGDYPYLDELCNYLLKTKGQISVSSLRVDHCSDALFTLLTSSGIKTITFAPEAGSERLRKLINKKISNNTLYTTITKALSFNILNIKLYFLIGLPKETNEDIQEIVKMAKKIKKLMLQMGKKKQKIGTLTLSINPFIPKPHTPFERKPMEGPRSLNNKIKLIKKELRKERNIKIIHESVKSSILQGVLSMGDRKLNDVLLQAYKSKQNFSSAFHDSLVDSQFYIHRKKDSKEILPWDIIQ